MGLIRTNNNPRERRRAQTPFVNNDTNNFYQSGRYMANRLF